MKNITLFLPDSTYGALNHSAKNTGIELAHYCSNLLTDFVASGQVVDRSEKSGNGKPILRTKRSGDSKPEKLIPQMQLIEEIITFLRENGGKAEKPVVEEAIFRKHKVEFSQPQAQEVVGGNELRWKKNTQFARNAAREMGLIKSPSESGHGIWALTEKGQQWKFD